MILVIDAKFSRRKPFEEHCFFGHRQIFDAISFGTRASASGTASEHPGSHAAFTSEVSELSTLPPFSVTKPFRSSRYLSWMITDTLTTLEASISFSVRGARGRREKKSLLNATHRLTDADRPYMRAIAKRARSKNRM